MQETVNDKSSNTVFEIELVHNMAVTGIDPQYDQFIESFAQSLRHLRAWHSG